MRYPCSEKYLIQRLKAMFQSESGNEAERFDEALLWWKRTCGITLSGSEEQVAVEPVFIGNLKEHEKLPKQLLRRLPENEAEMRIESLQCAIRLDYRDSDDTHVLLKVTGLFVGKPRREGITLFIMLYNGNNELIGYDECGYTIDYEGEENTFDERIVVPNDEWISAVEIRFAPETQLF